MTMEGEAPTREEIEKQLRQILRSDTFAPLLTLRPLLQRLVSDTLDGKAGGKGYVSLLGKEVFGKPTDWNHVEQGAVRQGISNLREQLDVYYSAEGYSEPIGIRFPPRAGYAAQVFYRGVNTAKETVQRLATAFTYAFPDIANCDAVVRELEECVARHSSYAPAYPVLAEMLLTFALCDVGYAAKGPSPLLRAEEAVKTGMRLNGQIWHLHVIAGAIYCCRFAWAKADAAFKAALRLARDETLAHPWYAGFLLAVGRAEEAEHSFEVRLERSPRRFTLYSLTALMYLVRDFNKAYESLVVLSPAIMEALATAIVPQEDNGEVHEEDIQEEDVTFGVFEEWPANLLLACVCLALNDPRAALRHAVAGVAKSRFGAFRGLQLFASLTCDKTRAGNDDGRSAMVLKDVSGWRSPISRALAYTGAGRSGEAIAELERACEMGHPLMIWLHLWPIFDPLREHERFKALIKRMNLPQRDLPPSEG
jgi:tetratricopeptide (TPR) repeat protein